MDATRNQRTIAKPATVRGIGYFSGQDVRVEFRPAEVDTGIVFVRDDLAGCPRIAAAVAHRKEVPRRTTLSAGGVAVEMVEHVMAALGGLQVDNCEVHVDAEEMPGCDGSSLSFVEALDTAGIVEQDAPRPRKIIRELIRLGNDDCWIEARPCCSGKPILQYELDYGRDERIGHQTFEIPLSPESFRQGLAPSRTFVLEEEAAAFKAQGLGRRVTCKDLLVFGSQGPIDNRLRFPDECVRHKIVDMVGDLALAGRDLIGRISAYRSGHRLNVELVRAILAQEEGQSGLKRCA